VSTPSPGASGAATGAATASPSADTPAGTPARRPLTGVAQIDSADVAAQAKRAGLTTRGQPVEAWTWTDTNGRNLFLTTKLVRKTEGGAVRAATLYAYHAAGLDDRPRLLRTLQDPGTPDCPVEFALDFAPGSVAVADTDGDGYGEATVGYAALCAGDPSPRTVKLALVTEGTYFILRGRGLLASDPDLPAGVPYSGVTFRPNLPASRWPAGTYERTVALFRTLFR
jgi:hypothetical protein